MNNEQRVLSTAAVQAKLYHFQYTMARMLYQTNGLESALDYITGLVDRGMTDAGQMTLPGLERQGG